ncbi:MAG TPA: hypothetical protein VF170_13295 [Planctomycetaceae bacterium]
MAVQIPCPKCGSLLRLRDRSMLGRTGKCPKCDHRFTLAEPDEVELELAEPAAGEPVPVAAARRVSEGTPPTQPAAVTTADSSVPELPSFADGPATGSGIERLRHRKRFRGRRTEIVIGGIVALAAAGVIWAGYDYLRDQPPPTPVGQKEPPKQDAVYLSERDRLERTARLIAVDSPTQGEPISLRYVPAGASVVIHLRPAELWKHGSTGEEVRYCLGDGFQAWSEAQIAKYCLLPPAEIEEATICLILEARGSEPQVATVVRPVTPLKTSELIGRFDGSPQDVEGVQVYVGPERAYVIGQDLDDQKRPIFFATAPARLATDLALATSAPGITSDAIRAVLEQTDRRRHFTFAFQPADLRIHAETLVPSDLRPAWDRMLDHFGEDVEAAVWSIHFGQDFYSELLVRNDPRTTPAQLYDQITAELDALPGELVAAVSKMNPAEVGDRKVIGRLPAMTQLFAAATVGGTGDRLVLLQTRLPERAGPNLALAGLLAWHESTRTDFTKSASEPTPPGSATLAERLKKPIEVDFRRTPLEEAFAYIGGETGIEFEIDGDALKFSGYTRNMPQTLALGAVPAEKAVAAILAQYDKMAVVLDEANGKAVVTTKPVAEEKGLTPATFTP